MCLCVSAIKQGCRPNAIFALKRRRLAMCGGAEAQASLLNVSDKYVEISAVVKSRKLRYLKLHERIAE